MALDGNGVRCALRVLQSAISQVEPNPADVNTLRHLAPQDLQTLPVDDLACWLIRRYLDERFPGRAKWNPELLQLSKSVERDARRDVGDV